MERIGLLEELFGRWSKKDDITLFVEDGIICPEIYEKQNLKLLYVLRDAHVVDKSVNKCDLRADLQNPKGEGRTWNNVARWTRAWLDQVDYGKVERIDAIALSEQLKRIAAMNLKKEAGGARAERIAEFARNHKAEIIEEISICCPDIIIACGTFNELKTIIFKEKIVAVESINNTKYSIMYVQVDDNTIPVIDFYHPQYNKNKMLYNDMLAIKNYVLKEV